MRLLLFISLFTSANGCWWYSKEESLKKIENVMQGTFVDRAIVQEMEEKLPAVFTWAVEKIGVETMFTDCDTNKDGKLTIDEARTSGTCLTSCWKLAVLNSIL